MMISKTKIAVLVAALFLGAQAGIAALEQDPNVASVESTQPETERQAEATATEPAAPEATAAAERPAVETPAPAPARIARSDTFPRSPDGRDMLPGLAAYLDQLDASRSHLVARGDVFPSSPDGIEDKLPALVAYLDQRDAARRNSSRPPLQRPPKASRHRSRWPRSNKPAATSKAASIPQTARAASGAGRFHLEHVRCSRSPSTSSGRTGRSW
jgi:hypothetical protein